MLKWVRKPRCTYCCDCLNRGRCNKFRVNGSIGIVLDYFRGIQPPKVSGNIRCYAVGILGLIVINLAGKYRTAVRSNLPDTLQAVWGGIRTSSGQNITFAAGVISVLWLELGRRSPKVESRPFTAISSPFFEAETHTWLSGMQRCKRYALTKAMAKKFLDTFYHTIYVIFGRVHP